MSNLKTMLSMARKPRAARIGATQSCLLVLGSAAFVAIQANAMGGDCPPTIDTDLTVIASTQSGGDFVAIGPASINADGSRIVFHAETVAGGSHLFEWSGGIAEPIQAISDLLDDLAVDPGDEVYLGDFALQRSGSTLAFVTQVNDEQRQMWLYDLLLKGSVESVDAGDAFTFLGQLSIDNSGLSFWQLSCDRGTCIHELLESLDPSLPPDTIVPGAPGVSVLAPVRVQDGSTLYLQHEEGVLSLRRTGVAEPVHLATNDRDTIGLLSGVAVNEAAQPQVALYLNDPLGSAAIPGIYVYDLENNAIESADLAVPLDGSLYGCYELAPPVDIRLSLNIDGDLGLTAIDTDSETIKALILHDGQLSELFEAGQTALDGGTIVSGIELLGMTDRVSGLVSVLFRATVDDGQDSWTVLATTTAEVAEPCPGDLNDDGSVGVPDLLELLSAWGVCGDPNDCPADLSGDGSVGVPDLLLLLGAWGVCPN